MSLLELIFLAMLLPVVAMAGNFGFNKAPNARDGFTFVITLLTFATVFEIYRRMESRTSSRFELFEVFPGVELAFHVEPLGVLFAMVASGLWIRGNYLGFRANGECKFPIRWRALWHSGRLDGARIVSAFCLWNWEGGIDAVSQMATCRDGGAHARFCTFARCGGCESGCVFDA